MNTEAMPAQGPVDVNVMPVLMLRTALCAEDMKTLNDWMVDTAKAANSRWKPDAERWRKALSAYERGVIHSHDGRTGEVDGYVSLFLQAIRERDGHNAELTGARSASERGTSDVE